MNAEDWLERCAQKTTEQLFEDMRQLHRVESEMLAPILAHLSEIDERDAALAEAFPSLFVYCVRELAYSEAEAFLRIRAARAARRFPRILGMVARREIHVTAVARIAPHLTPENYRSLLGKASRRTQEELQRLIAELAPQPESRPVIRTLSVGISAPADAGTPQEDLFVHRAEPSSDSGGQSAAAGEAAACLSSEENGEKRPARKAAARVLFHFVGRESLREKFKRAQELLWHKYPSGQPDRVFEDALDALLERKDPERRIARKLKRTAKGNAGPRS